MIMIMQDWRNIFVDGRVTTLQAGQVLFRQGDRVQSMYLVQKGVVALERMLPQGEPLVVNRAGGGALLAEASLFAEHYHCEAVARENSVLSMLDKSAMLDILHGDRGAGLSILAETAREVQRLRSRVEILRMKHVSARLDAWLDLNGAPQPGAWVKVAEAIGVTPPALYRELARRRARDPAQK